MSTSNKQQLLSENKEYLSNLKTSNNIDLKNKNKTITKFNLSKLKSDTNIKTNVNTNNINNILNNLNSHNTNKQPINKLSSNTIVKSNLSDSLRKVSNYNVNKESMNNISNYNNDNNETKTNINTDNDTKTNTSITSLQKLRLTENDLNQFSTENHTSILEVYRQEISKRIKALNTTFVHKPFNTVFNNKHTKTNSDNISLQLTSQANSNMETKNMNSQFILNGNIKKKIHSAVFNDEIVSLNYLKNNSNAHSYGNISSNTGNTGITNAYSYNSGQFHHNKNSTAVSGISGLSGTTNTGENSNTVNAGASTLKGNYLTIGKRDSIRNNSKKHSVKVSSYSKSKLVLPNSINYNINTPTSKSIFQTEISNNESKNNDNSTNNNASSIPKVRSSLYNSINKISKATKMSSVFNSMKTDHITNNNNNTDRKNNYNSKRTDKDSENPYTITTIDDYYKNNFIYDNFDNSLFKRKNGYSFDKNAAKTDYNEDIEKKSKFLNSFNTNNNFTEVTNNSNRNIIYSNKKLHNNPNINKLQLNPYLANNNINNNADNSQNTKLTKTKEHSNTVSGVISNKRKFYSTNYNINEKQNQVSYKAKARRHIYSHIYRNMNASSNNEFHKFISDKNNKQQLETYAKEHPLVTHFNFLNKQTEMLTNSVVHDPKNVKESEGNDFKAKVAKAKIEIEEMLVKASPSIILKPLYKDMIAKEVGLDLNSSNCFSKTSKKNRISNSQAGFSNRLNANAGNIQKQLSIINTFNNTKNSSKNVNNANTSDNKYKKKMIRTNTNMSVTSFFQNNNNNTTLNNTAISINEIRTKSKQPYSYLLHPLKSRWRTFEISFEERFYTKKNISEPIYSKTVIENPELQSKIVIDELNLLFETVILLKTMYLRHPNVENLFKTWSSQIKVYLNISVEEIIALQLGICQTILSDFHNYLDKFIVANPPCPQSLTGSEVNNEDKVFIFNIKLYHEVSLYMKSCFDVYQIIIKTVEEVVLKGFEFRKLTQFLIRCRMKLSEVLFFFNNKFREFKNDKDELDKLLFNQTRVYSDAGKNFKGEQEPEQFLKIRDKKAKYLLSSNDYYNTKNKYCWEGVQSLLVSK